MPSREQVSRSGQRADPAPAYKYYVEIDGVFVAEFTECAGLEVQREVKTYEEGGVNNYLHKLPGRLKNDTNIRLKRGITYSRQLWDWFYAGAFDGRVVRQSLSIVLGTVDGFKAQHWNVDRAFPVRYRGPALKADSGEVAVEEIELTHHGLELAAIGASDRITRG